MQDVPNLGEQPDPALGEVRDAVHVAVISVEAGERLSPADRVFLKGGKAYSSILEFYEPMIGGGVGYADQIAEDTTVGIVDPFRLACVSQGERFWLCLYPGTIKSLRHHWTSPNFPLNLGEVTR